MTNVIYFFLFNLIIIVTKKNFPTHRFNPTQLNPCRLGWIGLDLCDGLGWVEFFLTHYDRLGQKIPSTQPNLTHVHPYCFPTNANEVTWSRLACTRTLKFGWEWFTGWAHPWLIWNSADFNPWKIASVGESQTFEQHGFCLGVQFLQFMNTKKNKSGSES